MRKFLLAIAVMGYAVMASMAQTVDVKMTVDMTYQMPGQVSSTELFDPATDYVDVAGSFNGWDGANNHLTLVADSDSLYTVTITGVEVGSTLEFKFRINGSWADETSEFPAGGANRKFLVKESGNEFTVVYNNYYPGYLPVTINVNMNKVIADGNFVAETDWVDVAGTFNGWGNGGYNQLWDVADGVYSGTVLAPVGEMKWKSRINSNWATSEFPNGGADRVFNVVDTVGGLVNEITVWYDDKVLAVNSELFENVSVYPNPASDLIHVENLDTNVAQVTVYNVVGAALLKANPVNAHVQFNVTNLASGVYFVNIADANGASKTIKVVKK